MNNVMIIICKKLFHIFSIRIFNPLKTSKDFVTTIHKFNKMDLLMNILLLAALGIKLFLTENYQLSFVKALIAFSVLVQISNFFDLQCVPFRIDPIPGLFTFQK